jgi:AraC-like DNA-binding protein
MPQDAAAVIPFIKLPGASLTSTDTISFGSVVDTFLPLQVHTWDHPEKGESFLNHSGSIRLGEITILSTWGSEIIGEVEQKSEAQFVLPYQAGTNSFEVFGHPFSFRSSSLFIPAACTRIRLHCTTCSGVIFSFPPQTLLPVAHAIGGPGFDGLALQTALDQPAILSRRTDARRDRCQRLLMDALEFAERSVAIFGEVNPILRLDDLIRRLMVMMLVPDLLEASEPVVQAEEPFAHAALVEWALAHLHEPISLSDMEQRSHYSRRSLQLAFNKRYGCGPMQWLRRQRLAKARSMLEQPGRWGSIYEVAMACGYLSQAYFSRDFLNRYGERPSAVWRRSRMAGGMALPPSQDP